LSFTIFVELVLRFFYQVGEGYPSGEPGKDVDMISNAADLQRFASQTSQGCR